MERITNVALIINKPLSGNARLAREMIVRKI